MGRPARSISPEARDTLRALRRAANRALELGLQMGTPVYVWKDGKIVDLTKERRPSKKSQPQKSQSKKSKSKSSLK
jgi:hypothetical protein